MRLLWIPFLIVFLNTMSYAQGLSLRAGINIGTFSAEVEGADLDDFYSARIGFHFGAAYELPVLEWLSVEPGILFSSQGPESEFFYLPDDTVITQYNLGYFHIELPLKSEFSLSGGWSIYAKTGPYLALGFAGSIIEDDEKRNIEWGNDPGLDDFASYDYGLLAGLGIAYRQFNIEGVYEIGAPNLYPDDPSHAELNNRIFRITLAYYL